MKTDLDLESRPSRDPSMVSRKIASEFILVPIRQKAGDIDCIYAINEVAGRIWELIDGTRSVNDICNIITEEFDVGLHEASQDVIEFVQQLAQIDAIEAI